MLRTKRFAAAATGLLAAAGLAGTLVSAGAAAATDSAAGHRPPLGTRADVPWSKVGAGWSLATWSARTGGKSVLFLITPSGGRYTIASGLPAYTYPQLLSARGDGAVLGEGDRSQQIDLRTGRTHDITLAHYAEVVSYAGRHSTDLITATDGEYGHLTRTTASGRPVATYPSTVAGAGAVGSSVLTNDAGTRLVAGASHGLVLFDGAGAVVRRLHPVSQQCYAASWWTKDVAVADCGGTLWAVPTSGRPATKVSAGALSTPTRLGYADIWRTGAGRLGLAESGCGPRPLARFDARGVGHIVSVPSPTGRPGTNRVVGHRGDTVHLIHRSITGCVSGTNSFFGWNARTGHELVYLGAPATSGTVIDAVDYPAS